MRVFNGGIIRVRSNKNGSLTNSIYVRQGRTGRADRIVKPTGDYEADWNRGESYANEFLFEMGYRSPALLGQIVRNMPTEFTAIEFGFLGKLSETLKAS